MRQKFSHLIIEFVALTIASLLVVNIDQALNTTIWGIARVINVNECKLFYRIEAFPVVIEGIDFLLSGILVTEKNKCIVMGAHLFFIFFLFVKLGEKFAIDAVEVDAMLSLDEPSETVVVKEFIQLSLCDVAAVILSSPITNILATQDLITMSIVPGALLVV